jgi:hypothetical protein
MQSPTTTWYKVVFTDDQIIDGQYLQAGIDISRTLRAGGRPKDGAVFSQDRAGASTLYFSPKAAELCAGIIAARSGSPCSKPAKAGLSLMHGYPSAWKLLE